MDLKQIVLLALQVSILITVFGFGLNATTADLLYLLRRPGLLARSLLAMFVIVPILVVAVVPIFNLTRAVEVVIVALSLSPVPPLLPRKEDKGSGPSAYGLGLMVILAVASIVLIPLELELLQRYVGRELSMAPSAIAGVVVKAVVLPILAGMLIRAFAPAVAARIEKPVVLIGNILLPLAVVALLAGTYSAIWALVGDGTVMALTIFTVAGLAVGHVLGGPDPEHATVLALSTACRHPAIAFAIATANFPDRSFGPLILMYVLVNAILGIPYLAWRRRRRAGGTRIEAANGRR